MGKILYSNRRSEQSNWWRPEQEENTACQCDSTCTVSSNNEQGYAFTGEIEALQSGAHLKPSSSEHGVVKLHFVPILHEFLGKRQENEKISGTHKKP